MSWEKEAKNIAKWMRNYNKDAGTSGYVLGLSGGLDSAVSAALAKEAVGKDNVIVIYMSCYSNPSSFYDAFSVAQQLGFIIRQEPLEEIYDIIIEKRYGSFKNCLLTNIASGNIKARLRMLILYDMANQNNKLVLGTGNFSEIKLGYFTKFGDGACDIEPLGNYLKTEIYELAKTLSIPQEIIDKPPSADLWEGQTDEEELGMSYKKIDKILIALLTKQRDLLDSIPIEDMDKILKLVKINEHKNRVPPRPIRYSPITKCLDLL